MEWHHWVRNKDNIPKHAFIAWMATLRKLRTKSKLLQAGVCQDDDCLLCNHGTDSCQYLFYQCAFSNQVYNSIMR